MKRRYVSLLVLTALIGLATCWWLERRGVENTEALLRGDESVRLDSLEIAYQQRQVFCTDPVCLRYFERCFRENAPSQFDDRLLYRITLRFSSGGSISLLTDWSKSGFSLSMPGDRPLQDGGTPRAWVVFRAPIPGQVKEMIDFLFDESPIARGSVLFLESNGNRKETDPSLKR